MVKEIGILALRAVLGGAFVVLFTLIGEWLRPKSFAGLFAAAPSVALASLLITLVTKGEHAAWLAALGMIVGAVAFVGAAVVAIDSVKRFRATQGAIGAILVWLLVAGGLWTVLLR